MTHSFLTHRFSVWSQCLFRLSSNHRTRVLCATSELMALFCLFPALLTLALGQPVGPVEGVGPVLLICPSFTGPSVLTRLEPCLHSPLGQCGPSGLPEASLHQGFALLQIPRKEVVAGGSWRSACLFSGTATDTEPRGKRQLVGRLPVCPNSSKELGALRVLTLGCVLGLWF